MKWTVLSDNRTQNPSLQTEHGLSILLETDKHRILLDTGASDVFIRNAEVMGIDLSTVDYVFISHGHSDHAGGLKHFMSINDKAQIIVSPHAVSGKFFRPVRLNEVLRTLKASPLNSRVVHSTPGYDKCIASTLKESPNYAVGALFQSACLRRNLSVGPSDTTAIER